MANEQVSIIIKAFDATQRALRSIQAGFSKLSKIFFNFKTALISVAGAGGFGLLIRQSLITTDVLAKTAGRIGTTTEALSKLQFVGSLAGIETNTLNMALQRFVRRTAEAAEGTGEAVRALRELGIDAREIQQLPLDQRMQRLADAFGNVTNENDKLRLAFKLFDSEGTAVLNMLESNSQEMGNLFKEAEQLGLVMSTSAATGVEDANDALTRLGSLFTGVTRQTTAGLAPAIEILAEQFKNFVLRLTEANGGITGLGSYLAGTFIDSIIGTIAFIERLINGAIGIANAFKQAAFAVQDFFTFGDLEPPDLIPKVDITSKVIKPLQEAKEAALNATQEVAQAIDTVAVTAQEPFYMPLITGLKHFSNGIENVIEKMPGIELAVESFAQGAMKTFTDQFTAAVTGAKNFGDAMKGLAKSVVDSLIQMLVQYYITKPLFDALGVKIADAFPSATPVAPKAMGGPVAGGRPYMVGERGPELMVPTGNGRIVPNNKLGGSGFTIVQNINVTTGVEQTVRAEIANLLPQISNATKAAVADSRMRGGNYGAALVGA